MVDHATHDTEPVLLARRLGIDTYQHPIVYMRLDCHVCRSQGFAAHSQPTRMAVRRARAGIPPRLARHSAPWRPQWH